jgi:hypothetical protein
MTTVNPSNIKTLDQWVNAYKKHRNVVLDVDGSFLVLDPKLVRDDPARARKEPVVKIKHVYSKDALIALAQDDTEIRAEALETVGKALEAIKKETAESLRSFSNAEKQLLEATDAYKMTRTQTQRMTTLQEVALKTKLMMDEGTKYSESRTPLRYVKMLYGVPRNHIDYTTNDERAIPSLMVLQPQRIGRLTVEDTA